MQDTNASYQQLDQEHYLQVFNRLPVTFEKGKGARLWDVEGNEYIDALAGIAVTSVGHSHPRVVEAIQQQAEKLVHISNFFLSKPQVALSEKLTALSGMDRVFIANSGTESVEGAIKIARKYAQSVGRGGEIISFTGSFHGRTLATIATGKKEMQEGFEPIPGGFTQVAFNDMKAVRDAVSKETAAIIIEPIQGEGGINVADADFLNELRTFCTENDIVLIFDEIQCGMARTGHWFAKDYFGIEPDIMTLAKALGGGVPIGAVLSNEKVSAVMGFGSHGTTFGGNPLVCATSLAVISVMEREHLLQQAKEKGEWLMKRIRAIDDGSIADVRGAGLMIGVAFNFEAKPLVEAMLERGVVANATAGNVLRLVPPLTITYEELKEVVKVMQDAVKHIKTDSS